MCLSAPPPQPPPPFENEVWNATNEEENLGQAQMDGLLDNRADMSPPAMAAHLGGSGGLVRESLNSQGKVSNLAGFKNEPGQTRSNRNHM